MDRKGVEPLLRGLQDDAVHRHSARGPIEDVVLGAEDSNLHELVQSQPCCLVASAPMGTVRPFPSEGRTVQGGAATEN